MARAFWSDEDRHVGSSKTLFMRDYALRLGRKKDLRETEIQHLADLTCQTDVNAAIEYFETLPSNFKKSFKTAWRQRQHKQKATTARTKPVEFDFWGASHLEKLVEDYVSASGIEDGAKSIAVLRAEACEWAVMRIMELESSVTK